MRPAGRRRRRAGVGVRVWARGCGGEKRGGWGVRDGGSVRCWVAPVAAAGGLWEHVGRAIRGTVALPAMPPLPVGGWWGPGGGRSGSHDGARSQCNQRGKDRGICSQCSVAVRAVLGAHWERMSENCHISGERWSRGGRFPAIHPRCTRGGAAQRLRCRTGTDADQQSQRDQRGQARHVAGCEILGPPEARRLSQTSFSHPPTHPPIHLPAPTHCGGHCLWGGGWCWRSGPAWHMGRDARVGVYGEL